MLQKVTVLWYCPKSDPEELVSHLQAFFDLLSTARRKIASCSIMHATLVIVLWNVTLMHD